MLDQSVVDLKFRKISQYGLRIYSHIISLNSKYSNKLTLNT